MGDLTAPAAVSALSLAFGDTPGERSSFARFGERAPGLARRTAAEAMSRALGGRDRAPVASRPAGSRVRSRRARTLATMTGDVRFERAVPLDRAGDTACPLGDDLGLPMGGRASPSARGFLVTCGADVPFERTAGLMELGGGPRVSATAAMRSIRRAGEAVVATERKAARDLFSDGAAPEADREADRVLVEADGTHATTRGRSAKAEAKAMVAHAGKEGVTGGRVSRVDPVRLGRVGVAPGESWREAVAQVGTRLDLAKVERASLGTDGEAQCVSGISAMSSAAESDGHMGPFHVDRAVARRAPRDGRLAGAPVRLPEDVGPGLCAHAMRQMGGGGLLSAGWEKAADHLARHEAEIGGGPSMGTTEAERQHTYKVRMASLPCAWSPAGADATARVRSWVASGGEVPRRGREASISPRRRARGDARVASLAGPTPSRRVSPEGEGWEFPATAPVQGLRADVRYEAGLGRM